MFTGIRLNHLAHVFLAPDSRKHRIGSLLGDFIRDIDRNELEPAVREGLRHHLAVDAFTDRHPSVLASKALFSAQRRRFAGIALDILYDHYLIRHWSQFAEMDQQIFIDQVYEEVKTSEILMPAPMVRMTRRMVAYDWFGAYADLDNIGEALDRVAQRIRFSNRFQGAITEIRQIDAELEQHFLEFFPELLEFSRKI